MRSCVQVALPEVVGRKQQWETARLHVRWGYEKQGRLTGGQALERS